MYADMLGGYAHSVQLLMIPSGAPLPYRSTLGAARVPAPPRSALPSQRHDPLTAMPPAPACACCSCCGVGMLLLEDEADDAHFESLAA